MGPQSAQQHTGGHRSLASMGSQEALAALTPPHWPPGLWLEAKPCQAVADLHLTSQDSELGCVFLAPPGSKVPKAVPSLAPCSLMGRQPRGQDGQANAAAGEGGPCPLAPHSEASVLGREGPPRPSVTLPNPSGRDHSHTQLWPLGGPLAFRDWDSGTARGPGVARARSPLRLG